MEKIFINIHSVIDLITNSSTEIFVINTKKSIETVEEIIRKGEEMYPSEYGYKIYVDEANVCELQEMFGYYGEIDQMIEYLNHMGYDVVKTRETPKYLTLSIERGTINENMVHYIKKMFNVKLIRSE